MREIVEASLINPECGVDNWNIQAMVADLVDASKKALRAGDPSELDLQYLYPLTVNAQTAASAIGVLAARVAHHECEEEDRNAR